MVTKTHFFDKHPAILERCLEVNIELNNYLNQTKIAENEVSFDLILPFLFEDLKQQEAKHLSMELRLHREIVDRYNMGVSEVVEFRSVLKKIGSTIPVSFTEYQEINRQSRRFQNNDLLNSYLQSTERVYYRFRILSTLKLDTQTKNIIGQKVKEFSAFLLFDDDICDLETDIETRKQTILTQFLLGGNSLYNGIKNMIQLIKNGSEIFDEFTNQFKTLYTV